MLAVRRSPPPTYLHLARRLPSPARSKRSSSSRSRTSSGGILACCCPTRACRLGAFLFIQSSSSSSDDPPYSSYLKDLATLRNPSSPITFLSYLHAHGRLLNFINRGCIIPTRKEFADYLGWVAQYVQDRGVEVKYGHEVIGLEEAPDGLIDVRVRAIATGETIVLKASTSLRLLNFTSAETDRVFQRMW